MEKNCKKANTKILRCVRAKEVGETRLKLDGHSLYAIKSKHAQSLTCYILVGCNVTNLYTHAHADVHLPEAILTRPSDHCLEYCHNRLSFIKSFISLVSPW